MIYSGAASEVLVLVRPCLSKAELYKALIRTHEESAFLPSVSRKIRMEATMKWRFPVFGPFVLLALSLFALPIYAQTTAVKTRTAVPPRYDTVSYTHLDVYKRQAAVCA